MATLGGVCLTSDGLVPIRAGIDDALKNGVKHIAQPGGSTRGDELTVACQEHGIAMVDTHLLPFHPWLRLRMLPDFGQRRSDEAS